MLELDLTHDDVSVCVKVLIVTISQNVKQIIKINHTRVSRNNMFNIANKSIVNS